MNCSDWKISFGVPGDFRNKDAIARQCLEIANAAQFPTDYDDVFAHLFGNEDYTVCLAYDENDNLGGFSIFAKLEEIDTLYLHGIVLHPRAQGMGMSSRMIKMVLEDTDFTFLSARTHNPRMFEALSKFACSTSEYYPNAETENIPEYVYNLVASNPFAGVVDECLIARRAYPDEKIAQTFRNEKISKIFSRLQPNDAQVIVVKVK